MKESDYFDDYFNAALSCFKKAELDRASTLCMQILEQKPMHADTLNLFGIISLKQGSYETAVEQIQRAIIANPQKAAPFSLNIALVYEASGNWPAAIATYKQAAALFLKQGNKEETINALLKAAILTREGGSLNESRTLYEEVLQLDGENTLALNDLGYIYLHEGNLEKARYYSQLALDKMPNHAALRNNVDILSR